MALTASDWQNLILLEVGGDLYPNSVPATTLQTMLPIIWAGWADKALIAPRLQYLYTKKQAAEYLMGRLRTNIDVNISPLNVSQSQLFKNAAAIVEQTDKDIAELLQRTRASRPMAVAPFNQQAPVTAPPFAPVVTPLDANDPALRGDPYRRTAGGGLR